MRKEATTVNMRAHDQLLLLLLKAYALLSPIAFVRLGGNAVTFIDLAMPVAALFIVARGLRHVPPTYYIYLAFIACALLSVFFSSSSQVGLAKFVLALRLFAISAPFALVFLLYDSSVSAMREVVKFALIGMGLAVGIGLLLHMLGIQTAESQQIWYQSGGRTVSSYRAAGLVGNSGAYGQQIAIFGGLLFAARTLSLKVPTPLAIGGWMLVLAGLVVSSSRGGMMMLLIFLFFFLFFRLERVKEVVVLGIPVLILGIVALPLVGAAGLIETSLNRLDIFNLTGDSRFAQSARLDTWGMLIGRIWDVPTFGYGYKSFYDLTGILVDNSFLLTLFEVGMFGLALFCAFWIVVVIRLLNDCVTRASPYSALGFALCMAFVSRMQTGGAHTDWSNAPVVFLVVAVALRMAQDARAERRAASREAARVAQEALRRPGPAPAG